jgi:type IV secretory pathway VirB10-like protein
MAKKPSLAEQLGQRRQPQEPVQPVNPVQALAATLQQTEQVEEAAPTKEARPVTRKQREKPAQSAAPSGDGSTQERRHGRIPGHSGTVSERSGGLTIDALYRKLQWRKHLSSYTFRYRVEELDELSEIFTELDERDPGKISRNDIARLSLLWLCEDYRQNGEASVLEQMLRRM